MRRAIAFLFLALRSVAAYRVETTNEIANDLKRDLSRTELPRRLTLRERRRDRSSLLFVRHMLQMRGKPYEETFCSRSGDNCSTVLGYPGGKKRTMSLLTHERIVEELATIPTREAEGKIRRGGDLGYFIFNHLLWDKDWAVFPIGADVQDHRLGRTIIDSITAQGSSAWSREMVKGMAQAFFKGRKNIDQESINVWVATCLHKILLNMELTDAEGKDFNDYKKKAFGMSFLPKWLTSMLRGKFQVKKTRARRDVWLEEYSKAMQADTRGFYPKDLQVRDQRFVADLMLTAMSFAGGSSLPNILRLTLAVLKSSKSPLPEAQRLGIGSKQVEQLVYETVRRYPVVMGFPWYDSDMKFRTVANLAMALRDSRVWGEDALEFKLRPLSHYHKYATVAWAMQAKGTTGAATPDSRGCPAYELSMVLATEFMNAFLESEWEVSHSAKDGGIAITEGPSMATDFVLSRPSDKAWFSVQDSAGESRGYVTLHSAGNSWPAMLRIYPSENYTRDDPNEGRRVELEKVSDITLVGEKCFQFDGGDPLVLCPESPRDHWLQRLKTELTKSKGLRITKDGSDHGEVQFHEGSEEELADNMLSLAGDMR